MSSSNFKFSTKDYQKLSVLAEIASYSIDDILVDLGVDYKKSGKMYIGTCPVHGGDKANAWNYYPDGYAVRGIWKCRTQQCEKIFQRTIPGLIRGILSRKNGWTTGKPLIHMSVVIQYLCKFLKQNWNDLKVNTSEQDKKQFISEITNLGLEYKPKKDGWALSLIKPKLDIPSEYFLNRGFNRDILIEFSAGQSNSDDKYNPMYKRAVIPVFDRDGEMVIGVTGRSILDQCSKCKMWHDDVCPAKESLGYPQYAKWRHSKGFASEVHLFNFHIAKKEVEKKRSLNIVEGPLDCMNLCQHGERNTVALFGINLSDQQTILLESLNINKINLLLDKDKAGLNGIEEIQKKLYKLFKINIPDFEGKDPGELSMEEIKELNL